MKKNTLTKIKLSVFLVNLFLLGVAVLAIFGCAHLKDPQSQLLFEIESAARIGTQIALAEHPEWREKFVAARDDLKEVLSGEIKPGQIRHILDQLPVKELKSPTAQILIAEAEIRFGRYLEPLTDIEKLAALKNVAQAIHNGLDYSLK